MRNAKLCSRVIAVSWLAGACGPGMCQDVASATGASASDITVVHPDDDGYRDLVAAFAALQSKSVAMKVLSDESNSYYLDLSASTLAEKHAALHDPAAQTALGLIRSAAAAPHLTPVAADYEHIEYLPLERLLMLNQYIQFADGNTRGALETLALALRLSNAMEPTGHENGVFASSFRLDLGRSTALHLRQLNARDCVMLLEIMRRELGQTEPFLAQCEAERKRRKSLLNINEAVKVIPRSPEEQAIEGQYRTKYPFAPDDADRQAAAEYLASHPEARAMLTEAIGNDIDAYYDDLEARYRSFPDNPANTLKPTRGLRITGFAALDNVAAYIVNLSTLPAGTEEFQIEKRIRVRAEQRLLAVHAAIGVYRWEHNALPESLDVLNLHDLGIDPFSGKPFTYKRDGSLRYNLESIGGPKRNSDANLVAGASRVPISLPVP